MSEHETVVLESKKFEKVFSHHGIPPVVTGVPKEYKITLNACVGAGLSS